MSFPLAPLQYYRRLEDHLEQYAVWWELQHKRGGGLAGNTSLSFVWVKLKRGRLCQREEEQFLLSPPLAKAPGLCDVLFLRCPDPSPSPQ